MGRRTVQMARTNRQISVSMVTWKQLLKLSISRLVSSALSCSLQAVGSGQWALLLFFLSFFFFLFEILQINSLKKMFYKTFTTSKWLWRDNSTMFRQFNLGLNKRVGYALSTKDTSSQCVLWLLCWIIALIMWPCLVWMFRDVSALVWTLVGSVQSLRVVSQPLASVGLSPSSYSSHKLSLVKKKAFPLFICGR